MLFDDLLERMRTPAKRKFHATIRDDHVLDEGYQARLIAPNAAYFDIRLTEMFLSYRSEYGRSFVPLAVMASEFAYGGTSRSFPFFVGSELLHDLDAYVKGQDVSFHNTRVVGPVPYSGGDVAVFVGLYRAQVDDFARKLLQVLGQMVGVFDLSKLSGYIDVAGKLADGLCSLLKFEQLEYRIGDRDVFQDHGSKLFKAGYFVYVNCDETALKTDQLWVQGGVLKVGSAAESLRSLNDYDYCLMQIQSYDARQDYTSLPFHKKWNEVRAEVSKGDNALAHTLFVQCCQEIANSPDLTPPQAEALIQAYQANYAKVVELYARLRTPPPAQVATVYRGVAGKTPQQSIRNTAQVAQAAGVKKKALQGLVDLSEHWSELPHLGSPKEELTDAFLGKQLASIESFTKKRVPDPKGLANAIAIASVAAA